MNRSTDFGLSESGIIQSSGPSLMTRIRLAEKESPSMKRYSAYLRFLEKDLLVKFQVEMIRRFKPQVIVGHDVNGEYQHGAHIANTYSLRKALEPAADAEQYPESAQQYGTWSVPKTYLHLWEENKIVMNWDVPLSQFDGKRRSKLQNWDMPAIAPNNGLGLPDG